MREYFARAVNKATGVHTAPWVMPNHPPIFPPGEPETASANLDAQGGVVVRYRVCDGGYLPAPAASPSAASTVGLPSAPQTALHHAVESPDAPAADGLPVSPGRAPYEAAPVARFTSQPAGKISRRVEIAPRPADPRRSSANTTAGHEQAVARARPWVDEPIVAHDLGLPSRDRRRELPEDLQVLPRQSAVQEATLAATGETVVQVHIGRVEVRMAAPATAPAPSPARPKGPRGFAEYEAMRRYTTRTRF